MFTIKDEVQNPEGISATDISFGDGTVAEAIAKKQDAETGKGLSSNDYTNDDKAKLAALPTNTALQSALEGKQAAGNYVMNGSGTMPGGQTFVGGAAVGYFRESNVNKGIIISGSAASALSETAPLEYLRFNRSTKRIEHQIYDGTNWSTVMTFTADEDTGWQTLTMNSSVTGGGFQYRRKNGIVFVRITGIKMTPGDSWTEAGVMPTGFRPTAQSVFEVYYGSHGSGHMMIMPDGKVSMSKDKDCTQTNNQFFGHVSFPV